MAKASWGEYFEQHSSAVSTASWKILYSLTLVAAWCLASRWRQNGQLPKAQPPYVYYLLLFLFGVPCPSHSRSCVPSTPRDVVLALIKTPFLNMLVMSVPASIKTALPALLVIPFPAFFETLFLALLVAKSLTSFKTLSLTLQSFLLCLRFYPLFSSRYYTCSPRETILYAPRHWTAIMHTYSIQATLGLALLLADTVRTKAVFAHYMVRSQTPFFPRKAAIDCAFPGGHYRRGPCATRYWWRNRHGVSTVEKRLSWRKKTLTA